MCYLNYGEKGASGYATRDSNWLTFTILDSMGCLAKKPSAFVLTITPMVSNIIKAEWICLSKLSPSANLERTIYVHLIHRGAIFLAGMS